MGKTPTRRCHPLVRAPPRPQPVIDMAVRLNQRAFAHAKRLIEEESVVLDEADAWSDHRPSTQRENRFLEEYGVSEYRKWYLGFDEDEEEDSKNRYKFPYGDFDRIHRCAVLSTEARASQYKYSDIETAAAHLQTLMTTGKPARHPPL